MSIYRTLSRIGMRFASRHTLFKHGFNLSPMYRRTTARVTSITPDLCEATVRLPLSWRNRNYVGSIFGGSLYAAVDPIYMIQLIYVLGEEYVVWDKAAEIRFKAPAREDVYADFRFTPEEIEEIRAAADADGEVVLDKEVVLMDRARERVFCEVTKTLYVATKAHYRDKLARRAAGMS